MLSIDPVTRLAYDAGVTIGAKVTAIKDALADPVSVTVYDGSDNVKGSGTLTTPWCTLQNNRIILSQMLSFTVSSTGTPDATWKLRLSSGTRWLEGSFGLTGSGSDFEWTLATWESGQVGRTGTSSLYAWTGTADKDAPAWFNVQNSTVLAWQNTDLKDLGTYPASTGFSYDLKNDATVPANVTPKFTVTSTPIVGVSVDELTGILAVANTVPSGTYSVSVDLTQQQQEGFLAQPGFTVSGTYTQGGTLNITGTNFGTGPTLTRNFWPYIEAGAEGSVLSGEYGGWTAGSGIVSNDTRIATDPVRGKVCQKIAGQLNSAIGYRFPADLPPNEWVYWSYWIKRDNRVWDASPTQGGQHKIVKVTTVWPDVNATNPEFSIYYYVWEKSPTGPGTNQTYLGSDYGLSTNYDNYFSFPSYTSTEWIRVEGEYFLGDIDGTPTPGDFKIASRLKDQPRVLRADTTPGITAGYISANTRRYDGIIFQNYFGNGYNEQTTCLHDDHYFQIGSRARLELTDSPVWGQDLNAEVQGLNSWSNTSIQATLNVGGHGTISGKYLHIIKHDGTSTLVGQFV